MFLMPDNKWARLLAYVTGLVNQELLLQSEYLIAENRSCERTFRPVCGFPIPSDPLWTGNPFCLNLRWIFSVCAALAIAKR
jgi:hypothetical protein